MEQKDLNKLIKAHVAFKERIKAREDKCKADNEQDKATLAKIQAKLQTVIHKDNDEGMAKVVLPDKSFTAYARYQDKYKVKDRDHLIEDYILEGLPDKYAKVLRDRLTIFGNTLVSDSIIDHRLDTGAEEENGRLVGGELVPGTGMYTIKEVRINKGNK